MSATAVTGLGLVSPLGEGVDTFVRGLTSPSADIPDDGCRPLLAPATSRDLLASVIEAALTEADWPEAATPPLLVLTGAAVSAANPAQAFAPASVFVRGRALVPSAVVSHACASALFGVELARRILDHGRAAAVLVAGASTLDPTLVASMRVTGAVTTGAARPFDRQRDGIHVGAGAGAVLLERRPRVPPKAVVLGCATGVAGRSAAASDPDRVAATIRGALDEAGARRLACVHAHATGTTQGDRVELDAISSTAARLGARRIPAVSVKGAVGHLLHSAGYASLVAAVSGLEGRPVAGTAHLHDPEEAPLVDLPGHAQSFAHDAGPVLVNAFGFGGNNASAVLAAA